MSDMITRAREISDLCSIEDISDEIVAKLAEEFYAEFGCRWTEILN